MAKVYATPGVYIEEKSAFPNSTAPMANSEDGLGTPFNNKAETWPPFGEEQLEISLRDRQMVDARVGFIIAAPILWLQEADREIDLNFQFTAATLGILLNLVENISFNPERDLEEVVSNLFFNALQISVSTPEGWFQIQRWKVDSPSQWLQSGAITLQLFLSNQDPPIVDNNTEVLGESYPSNWPLLKIVLNADHHVYLYSFVNELELELIQITTRVKGIKSLSLINGIGHIDASRPFQPFGPIPGPKAYLLVGCQELFSKRVSDLSLHLDWQNLPDDEGGLAEYFREYHQSIDNQSYQVQLSALSSSTFKPNQALKTTTFPLFIADQDDRLLTRTSIENFPIQDLQIKPDYKSRKLAEFSHSTQSGYFKLQLNGPRMAFGHALYSHLLAKAIIEQAQASSNFFARLTGSPKEVPFPKVDFTPLISRLSIDYTASTRLNFIPTYQEENDEYASEKVFKLYPYGYQEIFFETKAIDRFLFPQFEEGLFSVIP